MSEADVNKNSHAMACVEFGTKGKLSIEQKERNRNKIQEEGFSRNGAAKQVRINSLKGLMPREVLQLG